MKLRQPNDIKMLGFARGPTIPLEHRKQIADIFAEEHDKLVSAWNNVELIVLPDDIIHVIFDHYPATVRFIFRGVAKRFSQAYPPPAYEKISTWTIVDSLSNYWSVLAAREFVLASEIKHYHTNSIMHRFAWKYKDSLAITTILTETNSDVFYSYARTDRLPDHEFVIEYILNHAHLLPNPALQLLLHSAIYNNIHKAAAILSVSKNIWTNTTTKFLLCRASLEMFVATRPAWTQNIIRDINMELIYARGYPERSESRRVELIEYMICEGLLVLNEKTYHWLLVNYRGVTIELRRLGFAPI